MTGATVEAELGASAGGPGAGGLGLPGARLPLTLTVGFTGHRDVGDAAQAGRLLDSAFAVARAALGALPEAKIYEGEDQLGNAYEGAPRLRLLTGQAPGADRLAIARWRAAGLGETHMLYPFRDPATRRPLSDRPQKAGPDDHISAPSATDSWTGIDAAGLMIEADGHDELGRWLARYSDLLVAIWDGEPGRGPGGTADTLLHAFERRAPILWLKPGDAVVRLIRPSRRELSHHAASAMARAAAAAVEADAAALTALLVESFAPPGAPLLERHDPEVIARRDYAAVDPMQVRGVLAPFAWLLDHTAWRTFQVFKRLAGGGKRADEATSTSLPPSVAATPAFAYLTTARREAGHRAERLSDIHRSEQVLLIMIAVAAVFVGALPAMAPRGAEHAWHLAAAWAEALMGGFAVILATLARRAHRHRRWSDARRLAERLRGGAAAWSVGIDLTEAPLGRAHTWTEWRALAVLRAAGPRTGWLDRPELDAVVGWIAADLIEGQVRYHAREGAAARNIVRTIKTVEGVAFGLLMAALAGFLICNAIADSRHMTLPDWISGLVLMVSAAAPALGAAGLALEATNSFAETAERSDRFRREFERLERQIDSEALLSLHDVQHIARRAGQLLMEDADSWRDRLARRRLVRGP